MVAEHDERRELALALVNEMKDQLATTTRAVVRALEDGRISPIEGLGLGLKAVGLAQGVMSLLQGIDAATCREVLHVLEYADWVLPEMEH